jgi:hypothetical protein
MARILNQDFTAVADSTGESPAYSTWAEVGSATSLDASVSVTNNTAPDIWIQWTDDPGGAAPEDVDVFLVGNHPQHYIVVANDLTPAGTHVRVKVVSYEIDAECRAVIDTN